MTYQVELVEDEEGFAVSVPALPGCFSQGQTEAEALENIADAIREYVEVQTEIATDRKVRLIAIEV
jgi:predicted RNase H-like HicB family nuclease